MAASSPSALALSTTTRVAGSSVLLAVRRTPATRVAAVPSAQLRACSWGAPLHLRPELAAAPAPCAARCRAPLLRPRAWLSTSQIASSAFTLGTVAVLPFYTLMIAAPNANITKRAVESTAPYVALGLLYAYLLYLSWTPDTIRAMFASKYWLPEVTTPHVLSMLNTCSNTKIQYQHCALSECSCALAKSINNMYGPSILCVVAWHCEDVCERDDRRLRLDPPPSRRPLRRKASVPRWHQEQHRDQAFGFALPALLPHRDRRSRAH
ncbi:hypothetical protein VPH35_049102 [Triticum aestivum]